MARTTLRITDSMPAPHWALLERQLLDAITDAYLEFYDRYFDPRGYLLCVPRWGALDGADDAAENVDGLTDLYALGAPQVLLDRYRTGINGHIRQYTEARSPSTELARDGMYFREFPTSFDWLHNGEGYHPLFQEGLCDPGDGTWQARMRRFAGFYLGDDPLAPNYDPEHRVIRSLMNGSRGPVVRRAELADWAGEPFEPGRFTPNRWHRTYEDYLEHFSTYRNVAGDNPCNLSATTMAFQTYLFSGEERYRDWILGYVDAWVERMAANDGIIPSNVGLDGVIGSAAGGRWYGGAYGWSHTLTGGPVVRHTPRHLGRSIHGFAMAMMLTGDRGYLEPWRTMIDRVNGRARPENGQTVYPQMHGDDGWYAYTPEPFQHAAGELRYWSRPVGDLGHTPWLSYLAGEDPGYPVRKLQDELARVRRQLREMDEDPTTPDTRLSENPNALNPAHAQALVELMAGGLGDGLASGMPLHACVRYFDREARRPGLPPRAAALVEGMTDGSVDLTLVNLDPGRSCSLVVQAGTYGEHRFVEAASGGATQPVGDSAVDVHLGPGAGARISFTLERFAARPTLSSPW